MGTPSFPLFAIGSIFFWILSITLLFLSGNNKKLEKTAIFVSLAGVLVLSAFITIIWIQIGRPPMRTLGETRMWYSFFLPLIGFLAYLRWHFKWFVIYTLSMAIVFLLLNYFHPENFDKALMPALQSPWFIPHVILFIFSYSILAASAIVACKGLYSIYFHKHSGDKTLLFADNLVYIGFSLFTIGMLFGALWAKEAWGHYWTWDPKETWAFITWMVYLIYMHVRRYRRKFVKTQLWTLFIGFAVLLVCWFGINYLPAAKASIHVYTN